MFWKKENINLTEIDNEFKIGLIKNGSSAKLIEEMIKYDCSVVFAPRKEQDKEFLYDYNSCKDVNGLFTKKVYDLNNRSVNIDDYVFIHKADYMNYLRFKENSRKRITLEMQQQIKDRYLELKSQRKVAKEFDISLSVCNRILNDKY